MFEKQWRKLFFQKFNLTAAKNDETTLRKQERERVHRVQDEDAVRHHVGQHTFRDTRPRFSP